MIETNNSVEI